MKSYDRKDSQYQSLAAKDRVLADWRRIDLFEAIRSQQNASVKVGDALPQILSKFKLNDRQKRHEIIQSWQQLIDPTITAHAQPTGISRQGTLMVCVDNNVWLSEILRYHKSEILEKLQHTYGKEVIKRIKFTVG